MTDEHGSREPEWGHRPGPPWAAPQGYGPPWAGRWGAPWPGARFAMPVIVALIQIVGTYFAAHRQTGHRPFDIIAVALLAAGPAALAFRNRYPPAVLGVAFLATLTYVLLDYPGGPIWLSLIISFVLAVMRGYRAMAVGIVVVGYLSFGWGGYLLGNQPAPTLAQALGVAAWILVLLIGSEMARGNRQRVMEAERTRAEESRRRASEERLRIARELHDVLAHNISLINVQAGVALHLMDQQPEQARTALTAIKQASNEALGELRSVLDILRHGSEGVPRSPTAGLADLDGLLERTRAAGLEVRKRIEGERRELPPRVDLAAFRIVQEALTNVTRHASTSAATLTLVYGDDELTVQIEDEGRGARADGRSTGGRGIAGMRERASALGGSLEAGPRPDGGFRVRATLPLAGVEVTQ